MALRLYRLVLCLYPRAFRERFGAAMEQSFARLVADTDGPIRRVGVVARELLDLVVARVSRRQEGVAPALTGGAVRSSPLDFVRDLGSDFRVAVRTLRDRPTYALVTLVVIGFGVGAGVAIYTVVHEVLLKPLPYRDGERIVIAFEASTRNERWDRFPTSAPTLREWRERAASFESIEVYRVQSPVLVEGELPTRLGGISVSPGTFAMLGAPPLLGRTLGEGDGQAVLLSEGLWRNAFGADPDIVGREIALDGQGHRVVGVMPAGFHYPPHSRADVWRPLDLTGAPDDPTARRLIAIGRLAPGITVEIAEQELGRITSGLARERGDEQFDTANVMPARDMSVWAVRPVLWLLTAAVALLLLIVVVNLAALGIARGLGRAREMAIRAAIGAGRARLVRLLVVESLVLALVGGALGFVVARWSVAELMGIVPPWPPSLSEATVDARGAALALALAVFMTVSIGLVPGLRLSRLGLVDGLREGGRAAGETPRRRRLRQGLVVTQLALAVILLFGASLMVRSMMNILAVDLGMDPEGVVTARVDAGAGASAAATAGVAVRAVEALGALPGVQEVSYADATPSGPGAGDWARVTIDGRTVEAEGAMGAEVRRIGAGYLELLRVPVVRGRALGSEDVAGAPRVALVNRRFVEAFLPGREPLGARIDTWAPIDMPDRALGSWEIVGVVPTLKENGPTGLEVPQILVPFEQDPTPAFSLLVRGRAVGQDLSTLVREAVAGLDGSRAVGRIAPLAVQLEATHRTHRFVLTLMIVFAAAAVLLALVGLYGVMAHNVGTRSREFAVRGALGADPATILAMVLRSGLALGLAGVAVGGLLALPLARGASDLMVVELLIGVTWWDPVTAIAVPVLIVLVVAAASVMPARRAARIDPREALQSEG